MDDLVTIQIKRETLKSIQDIAHELEFQDNRATAKPYFLVIRTKRWRTTLDSHAHGETRTVRINEDDDSTEFKSFEEYCAWAKAYDPDDDSDLAAGWDKLPEYTLEAYYDESNVFLTDKGFDEHVRLNKHNLGECHTYMKHAFRNPEMDAIFKLIAEVGKQT